MSCAVVINLDYENNSEIVCQEIWDAIKKRMIEAGFRLDNRVFITNRDKDEACTSARRVIEDMEEHLEFDQKKVFRYLKDFYAYDMDHTKNLMLPSNDEILVSTKSKF
ncbi:MAG: hypothetical protein OQK75_10905 [Gammaproteobacteria bacterium]|nr:hypothetical protein [Gammaproteobacteria bacterium]MCW8988160.1 hypothetical protein [Gammaproteobacteria bacterium]MCW9032292.1 hypothetical protein [Gammaproteobacteria bacterium]